MNTNIRIDVPVRLRRAIQDNDLPLVRRIVKNNASYLQNPDFNDLGNTSLHLAAANGFLEVVVRDSPKRLGLIPPNFTDIKVVLTKC